MTKKLQNTTQYHLREVYTHAQSCFNIHVTQKYEGFHRNDNANMMLISRVRDVILIGRVYEFPDANV